jgi:hypothetical protein
LILLRGFQSPLVWSSIAFLVSSWLIFNVHFSRSTLFEIAHTDNSSLSCLRNGVLICIADY